MVSLFRCPSSRMRRRLVGKTSSGAPLYEVWVARPLLHTFLPAKLSLRVFNLGVGGSPQLVKCASGTACNSALSLFIEVATPLRRHIVRAKGRARLSA